MIKYTPSPGLLYILLFALPVLAGAWVAQRASLNHQPATHHQQANDDVRCFTASIRFPIYDKSGVSLPNEFFNGTHRIFLYRDLVMYELPYGFSSGVDGQPSTVISETRYQYFVFEKDSISGQLYERGFPDSIGRRKADSMRLAFGGFRDTTNTGLFDHGKLPLFYTRRDKAAGSLLEVYNAADAKHPEDRDTLWLWFTDRYGMLPAKLFFVHDKDSLSQMRLALVHYQIHFHDLGTPAGQPVPDHGEFLWKIEETPFFNRDSTMIYFGRYQAYCDSCRRAAQKRG